MLSIQFEFPRGRVTLNTVKTSHRHPPPVLSQLHNTTKNQTLCLPFLYFSLSLSSVSSLICLLSPLSLFLSLFLFFSRSLAHIAVYLPSHFLFRSFFFLSQISLSSCMHHLSGNDLVTVILRALDRVCGWHLACLFSPKSQSTISPSWASSRLPGHPRLQQDGHAKPAVDTASHAGGAFRTWGARSGQ